MALFYDQNLKFASKLKLLNVMEFMSSLTDDLLSVVQTFTPSGKR